MLEFLITMLLTCGSYDLNKRRNALAKTSADGGDRYVSSSP